MKPKPRNADESFYNIETVASITECTGLTPSAVHDQEEADAYGELYSIHRQIPVNRQRNQDD